MTEKELNKFADKVAERVLSALEDKQKEWDNEFIENLNNDPNIETELLDEKELLQMQLVELQQKLDYYAENELYDTAAKIRNKITELEHRISKL
jgi:excinuclease UvrABC helicase subunit UvrB